MLSTLLAVSLLPLPFLILLGPLCRRGANMDALPDPRAQEAGVLRVELPQLRVVILREHGREEVVAHAAANSGGGGSSRGGGGCRSSSGSRVHR
jgi:uncharacterized membrane protein YgcG